MLTQWIKKAQQAEQTLLPTVVDDLNRPARFEHRIASRNSRTTLDAMLMVAHDGSNTMVSPYLNASWRFAYASGKGDRHRHNYIELIYVLEGTFRLETEGGVLEIAERELCFIDQEMPHRDDLTTPFTAVIVCMDRQLFDSEFLSKLDESPEKSITHFIQTALYQQKCGEGYLHLGETNPEEVERCLDIVLDELQRKRSGYEYVCRGYLLHLFDYLTPEVYAQLPNVDKQMFQRRLHERVIDYMKRNLAEVTLDDLNREFYFHRDYFNRLIQRYSGKSFSDLLKEYRMQEAADLLLRTDMTIAEISRWIGYQNTTYFYRIFHDCYGATPKEYRQQKQA